MTTPCGRRLQPVAHFAQHLHARLTTSLPHRPLVGPNALRRSAFHRGGAYGGGPLRFDGVFDGEAQLTGGVTGPGAGDGPFATSFTRQSLTPAPPAQAAGIGTPTVRDPFLRDRPGGR